MSNIAEWKLITFEQNKLSRDRFTSLINNQNQYLHDVHANLFTNMGSLDFFK